MSVIINIFFIILLFIPQISFSQDIINSQNSIKDKKSEILISTTKKTYKSLMFSDEDFENIKKAILSYQNGEVFEVASDNLQENGGNSEGQQEKELKELNERSRIYLASIIYISKDNWAIWLNKNKITNETNSKKNEFFVKEINHNNVKILWKLGFSKWKILSGKNDDFVPNLNSENQVVINFSLQPNQSFLLRHNKIIEGKDVSLISKKENKK